jgi:membrane protease YdiL (CAAX protease family)
VFLPVFAVFYAGVGLPRLLGHSIREPYLHTVLAVLAFALLFGSAAVVTWLADGPRGVRQLLRRMLVWRIGSPRLLLVVAGLPTLTLTAAALTGTLRHPAHGWLALVLAYVWDLLVLQTLTTNLWEEGLWAGFVQVRLMQRHRLVTASLLTAVPFVLLHLPVAFQNVSAADGLVSVIAVICVAPFLRYLAGTLLADTGGSILAVGLLHASFNASGHLSAASGGWQFLPAFILLTLIVIASRRWVRRPRLPSAPSAPPEPALPLLAAEDRNPTDDELRRAT